MLKLTGKRFGKLVVIRKIGLDKHKYVLWECKCDCGNYKIVPSVYLINGHTKACSHSCGSIKDLINYRFGKLIVKKLYNIDKKKELSGNVNVVVVQLSMLILETYFVKINLLKVAVVLRD